MATPVGVFHLDHFVLQAAQLSAVGEIVGLRVEHVVVAGGRDVGDHAFSTRSFRLMYSSRLMSGQC